MSFLTFRTRQQNFGCHWWYHRGCCSIFFIFLIRGNAVWYKKRHRRQRDDEGTANQSQNHMICFDQSGCRILTHTQTWNFCMTQGEQDVTQEGWVKRSRFKTWLGHCVRFSNKIVYLHCALFTQEYNGHQWLNSD